MHTKSVHGMNYHNQSRWKKKKEKKEPVLGFKNLKIKNQHKQFTYIPESTVFQRKPPNSIPCDPLWTSNKARSLYSNIQTTEE